MTFSKYKKTVIACILALGIGVGGGYYFFGSPVNTQPTNVREQTKQTKPITETRNTYVVQAAKESGPAVVGITTQVFQKDIFTTAKSVCESEPITVPVTVLPSDNDTVTSPFLAPATTCLLVIICPSLSISTPDPTPSPA